MGCAWFWLPKGLAPQPGTLPLRRPCQLGFTEGCNTADPPLHLCGWAPWHRCPPAPSAGPPAPAPPPAAAPTPAASRPAAAGWSGAAGRPPRCASLRGGWRVFRSKSVQRWGWASMLGVLQMVKAWCADLHGAQAWPQAAHSCPGVQASTPPLPLPTRHRLGALAACEDVALNSQAEPQVVDFQLAGRPNGCMGKGLVARGRARKGGVRDSAHKVGATGHGACKLVDGASVKHLPCRPVHPSYPSPAHLSSPARNSRRGG